MNRKDDISNKDISIHSANKTHEIQVLKLKLRADA